MVKFPEQYIQLSAHPGYYWNVFDKHLYSCKSGILKPLKLGKGFTGFSKFHGKHIDVEPGYSISVDGQKRRLSLKRLECLTIPSDAQIFPERARYD